MKTGSFFFLILFFTTASFSSFAEAVVSSETVVPVDYCYKPDKPLFFATQHYKNRYADDIAEYGRCQKSFIEMKKHVANMQKESEKISLKTWNNQDVHH